MAPPPKISTLRITIHRGGTFFCYDDGSHEFCDLLDFWRLTNGCHITLSSIHHLNWRVIIDIITVRKIFLNYMLS